MTIIVMCILGLVLIFGAILTILALQIKHEVKTGNAQTIAQLADSIETRRIMQIPETSRTTGEKDHLDTLHHKSSG